MNDGAPSEVLPVQQSLDQKIQDRLKFFSSQDPQIFLSEINEPGNVIHGPTASNEPYLYKTFERTRQMVNGGAIVGVGIDQVLNFMVNSSAEEGAIIDITPHQTLVTRAALEAGYRFEQLFGKAPTQEEFVSLFGKEMLETTMVLLGSEKFNGYRFSPEELADIRESLQGGTFYKYLSYQADPTIKDHNFWVSSDENIAKILYKYAQRKLRLYQGNILGGKVVGAVASDFQARGVPISLLYLSNVVGNPGFPISKAIVPKLLSTLHADPKSCVIVSTAPPYGSSEGKLPQDHDYTAFGWNKQWTYYVGRYGGENGRWINDNKPIQ